MRFTTNLKPIVFVQRHEDPMHVRNIHISEEVLSVGTPMVINNLLQTFQDYLQKYHTNKCVYRLVVENDEHIVLDKLKNKKKKKEILSPDEVQECLREFIKPFIAEAPPNG